MKKPTKTLTQAIQETEDDTTAICAAMTEAGIHPLAVNLVGKSLPIHFQGVIIAHAQDLSPEHMEDAIANVFLISMAFLYKRRYKTRKEALDAGQETIDGIAKELAQNIDKDFPELIKPARMN